MKQVDLYGRVRHAVLIEGISQREAARVFGVDPRTVAKMLAFSVPPGYREGRTVGGSCAYVVRQQCYSADMILKPFNFCT